ncbi:efflux RND transporter periplasmic adaptor subunit [candidate division CSSED10-310 bacterium]|uniref:Efflux RND transporter periplasmic adaptor subunit n=1 Tax=candidate division CSSED10-310 bacterium TaxID=2855610 RepID=A0ABV6YVW9_UNCC1
MTQRRFIKKVLPILVVLILSLLIAAGFVLTRPGPQKEAQTVPRIPVEVIVAQPTREQIIVSAMGTVIPARELQINTEVSGRIVEVSSHLIPGNYMKKGTVIARIDPRDYQVFVDQQQARLQEAESALEIERGRQEIALQELELMHKTTDMVTSDNALALRKPQLANARAVLESARSALFQAQLNLERTIIRSPFNAVVKSKTIAIGQVVTPQSPLAILVGADQYWVQVSVPLQHLSRITIPQHTGQPGAAARISQKIDENTITERKGQVIGLLSDLSPAGRLARLLVEIEDPLGLNLNPARHLTPLLIDSYVRVDINGLDVDHVFILPRAAVREGNKVWLMDKNDHLDIRTVTIAWRREHEVLVENGLEAGDRIIISNLATPIPGINLKEMKGDQTLAAADSVHDFDPEPKVLPGKENGHE